MEESISILWPCFEHSGEEEKDFSREFCGKLSRKLCEESEIPHLLWIEYEEEQSIDSIIPSVQGKMIVVTDPEIVLTPSTVILLSETVRTDACTACGPVYNFSEFPLQNAKIEIQYFSISSYLEVSRIVANKNDTFPVTSLDPACILFDEFFLAADILSHPVNKLFSTIKDNAAVHTGALVHRFSDANLHGRQDLVQLVPETVRKVLDIGCAGGGYGKTLKTLYPNIYLAGIEQDPNLAETAGRYYDDIIVGSLEHTEVEGCFDLINCGDVLEHLWNPWKALRQIHRLLHKEGFLILSIPNVAHWSVIEGLLKGNFKYIPAGLLCVSHIRWFTESSIREALREAGFSIEIFQKENHLPTPTGEKFIATLVENGYGNREQLLTNEFIIRAVKQ